MAKKPVLKNALKITGALISASLILLTIYVCIYGKDCLKIKIRNVGIRLITQHNTEKGIYGDTIIKWCTLPISHDLDQGGVPFDYQDITHPSIVHISKKFNGSNWWIAATPYPQTLPTSGEPYENTCIFHADSPHAPTIFKPIKRNPIIVKGDGLYNSDPELFFSEEDTTLYAYTRQKQKDLSYTIFSQSSKNGHDWSTPESVINIKGQALCPILVRNNGKIWLYTFETESNTTQHNTICFNIFESDSIKNPSFKKIATKKWTMNSNFWHGDIYVDNGMFYLVYAGTNIKYKYINGKPDNQKYLWLATSTDGINFTEHENPLLKMNGAYRASIVIKDNVLICYFSTLCKFEGADYPAGNRIGKFEIPLDRIKKGNP